jgi:histidine triad (HIT) family protein
MTTLDEDTADCFVCRKHRGEIVIPGGAIFEDEVLYVGHVQLPEGEAGAYLGHLMVEPKRHAPGLADLTDTEAQALGLMVARLSRALKVSEGAELRWMVRKFADPNGRNVRRRKRQCLTGITEC